MKSATVTIFTAPMRVSHDNAIDITVKSASTDTGRALAPTWAMVNGVKSGALGLETMLQGVRSMRDGS